jgi:DNA polymerase-3 subunit delta'
MSWQGVHGQDEVVEQFRRALRRGRLASSFLFVGPEGIGKRTFALKLAQSLLCPTRPEELLDPCGTCPACIQVAARTHPDLEIVAKPADRSSLPLELLIGDKEHRMREGLCHNIAMKPFMGGRKIALIDDADYLNAEGANCLLKTLEEPPPRSVLILISTSPAKQLPTIRSRCQLIRFQPLATDTVAKILVSQGLAADESEARRLAVHSEGSVQRALHLSDAEIWHFRDRFYRQLAEPVVDGVGLSRSAIAFVDEAGKEPAARRQRMRQVIRQAAEFYRQMLHELTGAADGGEPETRSIVRRALSNWRSGPDAIGAVLDRTLDALEQIDRNANPTTLLECWLCDLAKLASPPTATARK